MLEGVKRGDKIATLIAFMSFGLTVSNGMDAPIRNGIDVPKWKCHRPLEPRRAST
jgi:hypothetical protein